MYSPLNSYAYIHWILDFKYKYILLLCFLPVLRGCVWCLVCLRLCKEESSSPVSAITERRDMGLYEVPLFVPFWGFWDRDYVSHDMTYHFSVDVPLRI